MSYWIEVRCNIMKSRKCYSAVGNDIPMASTRNNTMQSIVHTNLELSRQAKILGWKEINKDWICPECQKEMK